MNQPAVILVVDDEAHILHVVSLKLRNAGFSVITAENGEEGLDAAIQHRPDLIITDYQMPLMSGIEMCTRIKADERISQVPALMLTARGFSIPPQTLAQTNIVSVLSKPFSPREVLQKVQEIVGELREGVGNPS
jgi:CheY-like chemotaxis protein